MDFLQENTFFDSQNVNILSGTSDADQIFGLEGNDFIFGAESGDQLFGNLGLDTVLGHQNDDEIFGGAEADLIFGGRGNDTVSGDDGSDTIHGDRGTDILRGGEGEDVFILGPGTGSFTVQTTNLIVDFEVGEDQIELIDGLTFANLRFEEISAGDTLIQDIESGEMLALLQGVSSSALTEESFVGVIPPEPPEPIVTLSLANDTGLDNQDNITSDPTLTGTVSNPAEVAELEITIDGEFVSINSEIAEEGTFILSENQLESALNISFAQNQTYTTQLRSVDTDGVESNIAELTFTLAVDGEPPEQEFEFFLPEIDFLPPFVSASLANDTGISDSDGITTDATITGTAIDNVGIAQLEVSIGGGFVPISTNIAGDGTYVLTQAQLESALNTNLTEGANTVSVRAIDTSGLRSPVAQVNFTLTSEVTPPQTPPEVTPPEVTPPEVDTQEPTITASLANDTGEDDSDGITSDATITGTATSNTGIAQLEVSLGGGFIPVSTNIAADGTFTLTQDQLETAFNTDLVDGAYTVSVQAVDTSSLVSETAELSFTLDTTPPTISAQLANDTGDNNSDGITSDPTITGTVSDASEIVALRAGSEGDLINISSQLEADGSFEVEQLQIEAFLGEFLVENTSYSLQLEAEDRSGLVTQTTVSFTLEEDPDETNPIDAPPPPEEIEMIDDDDEVPPAIQPPEEREVIEEPGNEEAFEITVSSNPIIYTGQVSADDREDFYAFTVETAGNISLDLTGLSSDADLILLDSNANPIDFSNAIAITDESITRPIDAGTYFIVVTSFDQETTEYDLGVVFTSRLASPPPELETDLVRYDFGYLYDGATLEDDFYLGYTYAEPGTFELNTFYDDFSGENEDGSNGLYFVFDDTGEVPSDAVLDEVYVLGYFDIDASDEDEDDPLDELYIPFYSANGLASGFEGLGSEYDFIALEDGTFDDFGFDFYEADGVEEIFSNTRFTRADYDANNEPGRMVNADLDSDGRDELIVTNTTNTGNQNSSFSILFNEGDGSFEAPVDILTDFPSEGDGDDPSIDVGDIDGDGNVDLIAVSPETNEISLYLGDGNGNLSAPGTVEVGDRPIVSATTDVDSDGNTDVVLINSEEFDFPFYTGDSLSVLFNRTGNSNVDLTAGEGVKDVVAADLDGDGDVDLATANEVENTVSVLINFGNIIFSDPIKYDVGDRPVNIIADDLDGDGTVDLATTDFGSDTVSVLRNSGDGFFAPALTFTTNENPSTLNSADLDGDGDSDLVMRNSVFFDDGDRQGNSISLLLNNGDATFNEPFSFTVGEVPVGLIVEDLDGNGLLDIATSNFDGQSVTVYLQS